MRRRIESEDKRSEGTRRGGLSGKVEDSESEPEGVGNLKVARSAGKGGGLTFSTRASSQLSLRGRFPKFRYFVSK